MAWRFPKKIGKEMAGSGWGESGGVPQGHGRENFLLTESGLRIHPGETPGLCPACRIPGWFSESKPNFSRGERLRAGVGALACPCRAQPLLPVCLHASGLVHVALVPVCETGTSRAWLGSGMWKMLVHEPRSPDHPGSFDFPCSAPSPGPPAPRSGPLQTQGGLSQPAACPGEAHGAR